MRMPIARTYPPEATPQVLADLSAGTLGKRAVTIGRGYRGHALLGLAKQSSRPSRIERAAASTCRQA